MTEVAVMWTGVGNFGIQRQDLSTEIGGLLMSIAQETDCPVGSGTMKEV